MEMPRILLVDDDADDRDIIIEALEQLHTGETVMCAENGEAALRLLFEYAGLNAFPCLIILDLNMPKMNGRQTLKTLKADERFRDIPVVIYSTSLNPLEKEACMALGAQFFITKPTTYNEGIETAKFFLQLCQPKSLAEK
jgi:CheY-like chemotaxis protein